MKTGETIKKEWLLVLIILPLGILLVWLGGDLAIRPDPHWSIEANMKSYLDPNSDYLTRPGKASIEPILPQILTPPIWWDTFLTPMTTYPTKPGHPTEVTQTPTSTEIPHTLTFTPSTTTTALSLTQTLTPSPTRTRLFPTRTFTPTATATAFIPIYTNTPTASNTPTNTPTRTPTPMATFTPTNTPTQTPTPTATFTPSATFTPTNTPTLTPTATPTSTNTPNSIEPDIGPPDGGIFDLGNGSMLVIDLGTTFDVSGGSEPSYDLVYYEYEHVPPGGYIRLDWLIIQISTDQVNWYTIYYWGDYIPETHTNVGGYTENDNEIILLSALYGTWPYQTGVTIDVDGAPGVPVPGVLNNTIPGPVPPGSYRYLRLYAPPGGASDGANLDSIDVLP